MVLKKEQDEITESLAKNMALRWLSVRARTVQEIRNRLLQRNVTLKTVDSVIQWLLDYGYLNDLEFARNWFSGSRAETRSVYLLTQELREKGISLEDINTVKAELDTENDIEAARRIARKKWITVARLPQTQQYRRLAGILARRGFNAGICNQVITEMREQ